MVGQYFSGTLQAHRVMDKFLCAKSQLYLEVATHRTLYLFDHRAQRVGVEVIIQNVYTQSKIIRHMKNTCKELRSRFYLLTDKANQQGNK